MPTPITSNLTAIQRIPARFRLTALRSSPRRPIFAGLAVLVLALVFTTGASAYTDQNEWNQPLSLDRQPAGFGSMAIRSIACPSATLCVGTDDSGGVITSTNPTGGASAWSEPAGIDGSYSLNNISCPTTTFCAAVDSNGRVLTSTNPTGGSGSWSAPVPLATGGYLYQIACPSTKLCVVAGGESGRIATSTDPTGGEGAWTSTSVSGTPYAVTCPSEKLCVLDDGGSTLDVSTDPTGGAGAWSFVSSNVVGVLHGPSCPSTKLCVAPSRTGIVGNRGGSITTTTEPTVSGSWSEPAEIDSEGVILEVTCPTETFCLAINENGEVFHSTNPTGGAAAWSAAVALAQRPVRSIGFQYIEETSVTCASPTLCLAYDRRGNVVTSTNPTGNASAWSAQAWVDGANAVYDISCTPSSLCVAVGENGSIVTSTTAKAKANAWTGPTTIDGMHGIYGVSCVGAGPCVAVDAAGNVITASNPTGGAGAWTAAHIDATTEGFGRQSALEDVSCPAASLCVAVDNDGNIITATNPTGGAGEWATPVKVASAGGGLTGVTCPSTALCIAWTNGEVAYTSTSPTGGVGAWKSVTVGGAGYFMSGLACAPGSTLCVAINRDGEAVTTTNPTGGAGAWSAPFTIHQGIGEYGLDAVSCPSTSYCVMLDGSGGAWASNNPTGGPSAWSAEVQGDPRINSSIPFVHAVSCVNQGLCVSADDAGRLVVANHVLPVNTAVPAITGTFVEGQTLSLKKGSWTNSPTSFSYQWWRCDEEDICSEVPGATGTTYDLTSADARSTIYVVETASNAEGATKQPATSPEVFIHRIGEPLEEEHEPEKPAGGGGGGGSTGSGGGGTTATAAQVTPPPVTPVPVVGQRQTISLVSGTVMVRLKRTSRFVSLSAATSIPDGSEVDATNGRVIITVATLTGTESAEAYGGRFVLHQDHTGSYATHFVLSLSLTGCPRVALPHGSAAAVANHSKHGPKSRHLWVSEHGGNWGTSGRYVSTTVEGTRWLTLDECSRSEVQVAAGKVKVRDLVRKKTKTLTAGQHYTAKRR
jgi:hypothetical protein